MVLSNEQDAALAAHLAAWQLPDALGPARQALRVLDAATPRALVSGTFLNAWGELACELLQDPDSNAFAFGIAASPEPRPLARHFPQLLPASPWEMLDAADYPLPHLAGVALRTARWQYVFLYVPSQDARARAALLARFGQQAGLETSFVDGFDGGLYCQGTLDLPAASLLPDAPWAAFFPATLLAYGYVSRRGAFPALKLRIPLVAKDSLAGGSITSLALSLELASLLGGPATRPGRSRHLGLLGALTVGQVALKVAGYWPLDGGTILLESTCEVGDLPELVGLPADIPLPKTGRAAVQFAIAKQSQALEKIELAFELTSWPLSTGSFALNLSEVQVALSSYYPSSLNLTTARFAATADLSGIRLRCTGSYPDNVFQLGLDPDTPVALQGLASALGVGDIGFLQTVFLTELAGSYHASTGYKSFRLRLGPGAGWRAGGLGFQLTDVSLNMYGSSSCVVKLEAAFAYVSTQNLDFKLNFAGSAEYDAGWLLSLRYVGQGVTLAAIGREFGFEGPTALTKFAITELGLTVDTAQQQQYFLAKGLATLFGKEVALELLINHSPEATSFSGSFSTTINDRPASFSISSKSGNGRELDVRLVFPIASVNVYLDAKTITQAPAGPGKDQLSENHFSGGTQGLSLSISDLLGELAANYGGVELPPELKPSLVLNDVYIAYDGATKYTNLLALSRLNGQELTLFYQHKGKGKPYIFGITTNVNDLSGLPLVGKQLAAIKLAGIGFVYASGAASFGLPALAGSPGAERTLSTQATKSYRSGFTLTGEVQGLPGLPTLALVLPISKEAPAAADNDDATGSKPAGGLTVVAPVPALTRAGKWFDVNRSLGPLELNKVGFSYEDGYLYLLLDLDLRLAVLVCSVEGLGVGFRPNELLAGNFGNFDYKLSGLGISYSVPGLTIDGAILKVPKGELSDEVEFQFDGALIVQAATWGLSAVASYAQLKSGAPSLFIFVDVDYPLGGPAFFFVEGLMGGFGINRALRMPTFEQVQQFPLLSAPVTGNAKARSMAKLRELENKDAPWIKPEAGQYWLAVGVKFSTFKFVYGQLLLVAEFGHDLKFSLLGLAQMALPLPPKNGAAARPFVYMELQMAAVVAPAEGFMGVAGSLTPNSYVLVKDCRLTGGFAYYMWYGPSPHAGQFVLTAGGYHPAFKAPDYYPQVPRMGYNWQVSSAVTIRGQSYFAITPSCGMAGTSLEVLFEAGPVKAWFTARADMLVTWHPLSFVAEIAVEVGASIELNLFFCHKTITVSIGASLTLWGPPLGGRVRLHIVVVDITISFGSEDALNKNHEVLPWDEFAHLLPERRDVCKLTASGGLVQLLKPAVAPTKPNDAEPDKWLVRAGTFRFATQSVIPIRSLSYGAATGGHSLVGSPVNVRPLNAADVSSVFKLTIAKGSLEGPDIYGSEYWPVDADGGGLSPIRGSVAAALWGTPLREDGQFVQAPATPSAEVLTDCLLGCEVRAPAPQAGDTFGLISLKELEAAVVATGTLPFGSEQAAAVPGRPGYWLVGLKPAEQLPLVKKSAKRAAVFAALQAAGLYAGESSDLAVLADDYGSLFQDYPLLVKA